MAWLGSHGKAGNGTARLSEAVGARHGEARHGIARQSRLGAAGRGGARLGSQGTASQAMVECGLSGLVTAGFSELPIMTAH